MIPDQTVISPMDDAFAAGNLLMPTDIMDAVADSRFRHTLCSEPRLILSYLPAPFQVPQPLEMEPDTRSQHAAGQGAQYLRPHDDSAFLPDNQQI